jgi:PAS domain S-box-containing protein
MSIYQRFLPYSVAIGSTAIALMLSLWAQLVLPQAIGAFFYIAIAITAWYGGVKPGIVAIVLALLALDYYFMPPIHQIWLTSLDDILWLALFLMVSLVITLLSSNLRQSTQKVEQLSRKLADENADRLKTALNAAQMGMWDWNVVTGAITWSPEHEQLFGMPIGSFDGRYETFEACLYPEDKDRLNQAITHSLQNQVPYHHEYRVVWADGSIHWVEGRGQALYNDNGQPVRMSGTIMAIDDRKQAQLLLQQQFEQQRLVMEITQRIRNSLNLQDILQTTVDEVRQFLQVDRVIIFQFAPGWGGTVIVESVTNQAFAILPFNIHDPCIGDTYVEPFQQGLVTAKADIYTADISPCHVEFLEQFQIRANLVVPILKNNELWGLLAAHHCTNPRQWQDSEVDLLRQIASQVSIALQQVALFEQVQTELVERQQAEAALQQFNTELEQRVAERTAELTTVNDRLRTALAEQQQAKQEVEDLYNNAPCGYHSLDTEGTIVRINDTELSWLGYRRDEVLNKMKFVHCMTPDSVQIFYQNFPRFMQQGWVNNLEFQLCHRDGSTRWVNISSTAIKDDAGNFVMSRTTLFDITERKHIEEQRKQAEQTLALQAVITRNMAEGICLVRADDATIVYANPKFEQMFGYDSGELNGQHVSIVNYASNSVTAEEINQSIRAAVFQNSEASYEVHNVKKDGTPFWCSATCSVFKHPEYGDVLVAVHQDITDRKQAEAVLQEAERRWRSLLDNVQMIVVGLDQSGHINYVNPFFLSLTGYSESEVISKNWFENFLPPANRASIQVVFSEVLAHNAHPYYQNSILTKSGEERFIAWNNTMLQAPDGTIIGTISIGEDITERQKVEEIKNEFIGIVSHELRTPLTSIQMSLGLLKSGIYAKKPEKTQRMIEIALLDTNRLVNLVNDILDLERLESGRTVLEKTVCQAADLMQQAVDGVQAIATPQNITLAITPTDATVWAAPDTIIQTLTNLLSNAIKFSPAHSVITLQSQRQADSVLFQVTDQGRGIPEDKLETIFGRFQQVDASDSREKGGTGLGLSICRSIIERHGGKIWAESTLGEGSTFFFTLPLPPERPV